MPIEVEKKFRLTADEQSRLLRRLEAIGATHVGKETEENTLYGNEHLNTYNSVLRVRRVSGRTILTYKERLMSSGVIKQRREEETGVANGAALDAILKALGCERTLVYEKHRDTWRVGDAEVVIDELPFGLFMEIEGSEVAITTAETQLECGALTVELQTYPQLARQYGKIVEGIVEARFDPA